tara:strand:+ start:7811 stop:9193 length:1383 start_codon:yes stop_codon:yes gene_type:complete
MDRRIRVFVFTLCFLVFGIFCFSNSVWAEDLKSLAKTVAGLKVAADTVWVMIAGFLVFFMHAGFAMLESGLCRAKNAVAILYKNLGVVAVSSIAFWVIGFAFMFGDGNSVMGTNGFFLSGPDNSPSLDPNYKGVFSSLGWTGVPLYAKFFFQLVFAATAATIVSGCVAERIKFSSFMIFSFLLVAIVYPIQGHWIWGGGWLSGMGFLDFAGSTVVHSVGGWAGLAGIIVLGPRIGKYTSEGKLSPMPGHNLPLVTLGGFILWLGWFGFNPGSTMAADADAISRIAVTTNLAAAAGVITSSIASRTMFGKADLSMSVNGALAGLVAITAPCANVTPMGAVIIGAIAGVVVCIAVPFFDKIKIDDPVGAVSVHLVCGIFGTLALGLFAAPSIDSGVVGLFYGGGTSLLFKQFIGVLAVGLFTFILSLVLWNIVKAMLGVRVSEEDEVAGIDISEHGMSAYTD